VKLSKIVKFAGIAIAVILVALLAFVAFMGYVGTDALSDRATDSALLKPDGAATGRALVVYNPGLTGAPKDMATAIANDLKAKGYEVMLAGVKSPAAANTSGYSVIVAGGPVYGGKVSPSVYSYLQALVPPAGAKVGAFAIGSSSDQSFPVATWLKATALFPPGEDIDRLRSDFEAELLK
jgi:hypothetical protein